MQFTEPKPLQPLTHGNILIVGAKASNFHDELRTHPRIIMWDSQNQHWTDKEVPDNIRAIFITRFISHAAFRTIIAEARKKQITIFNPQGTGTIAKQVKELLGMIKTESVQQEIKPMMPINVPTIQEYNMEKERRRSKLSPLIPFIDFDKSNIDAARALIPKVTELNIKTTVESLANLVAEYRKRTGVAPVRPVVIKATKSVSAMQDMDVSVQILDEMVKSLTDMRQFLIDTVAENSSLRNRLDKFKKMIAEEV